MTRSRYIHADFNGFLERGLLCLAHEDVVEDARGHRVSLRQGMVVTAFDYDSEDDGTPCWLVASGVVERSPGYARCRGSKWSLRIDDRGTRTEPVGGNAQSTLSERAAMSEQLDRAKRYHQAIHKVLMTCWDPIGVQGIPDAQDEYDAYVAAVFSRLIRHVARHELLDYLWTIETEHMGLHGDRQRAEHVVDKLLKVREQLESAV